jgi:hypothetical protein
MSTVLVPFKSDLKDTQLAALQLVVVPQQTLVNHENSPVC